MVRKLIFFIVILLSLAAGLAFGWVIKPGIQMQNPISSLREDFRSDYVLMVAEVYNKDADLDAAAARLAVLDKAAPTRAALVAAAYARSAGYSINDLDLLMALARDMQNTMPVSVESIK